MFNTTHIHKTAPYAQEITVNEHRAATDESMRIIQEMEDKVISRLLCKGHTKHPMFDLKWMVWRRPDLRDNVQFRGVITLQEATYDITGVIDQWEATRQEDIFEYVRQKVLEALSGYLTAHAFDSCTAFREVLQP
jgi:hypothetical protein